MELSVKNMVVAPLLSFSSLFVPLSIPYLQLLVANEQVPSGLLGSFRSEIDFSLSPVLHLGTC